MGGRYKLIFWGALFVAALATFGAYRLIASSNKSGDVVLRPVVVVTRDLPEGGVIEKLALKTVQWPIQSVPTGAYSNIDSVAGRVTRVAIFTNEAIVPGRLAPIGTGPGLELKIPPGQRAMAVRINDVAGISGLLLPNSRVDVLVTIREENSDRQVAKLFMSNMLVLSVGKEVQRDASGKPIDATTVTLAVTPEEVERLAIAMNTGSIQLVLRGYGESTIIATSGATSGDVLSQLKGGTPARPAPVTVKVPEKARVLLRPQPAPVQPVAAKPAPPPPPDSATINVYRAGRAEKQKFDTATKR